MTDNDNKHDVLARIESELAGIKISDDIDVGGHKYGLRVLERHEESYARSLFPPGTTVLQAYADQSLPVLAVALQSIDGALVEELFMPTPDLPIEEKQIIQTKEGMLRWRRLQVLTWLNDRPGTFVETLWFEYLGLKRKSEEKLEQLRPLSNGTLSGESKPMSSPEKESSSATPASPA